MITFLLHLPILLTFGLLALPIGRLLLSILPPGQPGGGAVHELAATLAASALLATMGMAVLRGLELMNPFAFSPAWILVLLPLLLVLRLAALPGAMVPRHQPPLERGTSTSRWTAMATAVLMAVVSFARDPSANETTRDWLGRTVR